jgi:dolichyl-phosphate-mannose-protein mannosyltransferase
VRTLQTVGIVALYDGSAQLYPPLSSFIFDVASRIEMNLPRSVRANDQALNVLLKLPPLVADLLTAWMLAGAVGVQPRLAVLVAAVYLFHPAVLYVSVFWGQMDSVYTALMVIGLVALEKNKLHSAWVSAAAAVGVKIQALAFLPVLLPATLTRGGKSALLQGVFLFVGVLLSLAAPWWLTGHFDSQFWNSIFLESRTPRAVVSGYNLWYLVLGDRAHTASSLFRLPLLGLSVRQFAYWLYGAYASFIALSVWQKRDRDLTLAAALTSFGLFMLPTEVHERFLFPVIALLLMAVTQDATRESNFRQTRFLVYAFLLVSLTFSFNLITIAQPSFIALFNLVAQPTDSVFIYVLKELALGVAALNLIVFGGLTVLFWKGSTATDARP